MSFTVRYLLLLSSISFTQLANAQGLQTSFDQRGLSKLSYNGVSLVDLNSGVGDAFYVGSYSLGGNGGWGGIGNTANWSASTQTLTWSWSWGNVKCQFVTLAASNTLTVNLSVTNSSSQVLNGIDIFPFGVKFPQLPQQFGDPSYPQFHNNLDNTSIIAADYGSGLLVLSNGDSKPLFLGFSPSPPTNHYALLAGTMNDSSEGFLATAIPVNRPVAAGQSDTYSFSLQFAPSGTDYHSLTSSVNKNFAQSWPQMLQWSDRRPIGELFMTNPTSSPTPNSSANPRNYTVSQSINIQTPQGLAAFQQATLAYADNSVNILKSMNAQGAIVWDLEGQQFPQPNTSYVGDPTQLPNMSPEMNSIADQFFAKFTSAGLRCGMTLRPQQLDFTVYPPNQNSIPIQNEAALLIGKIQYAYNRWGCTIYYVDSDGGPDDATAPSTFAQVLQALPNVLIIPENIWVKDSAYAAPLASFWAPYKPLHTTADEKLLWPNAFTVTYIGDAPNDDLSNNSAEPNQWNEFVKAVAGGDILSFRAWFDDEPLNNQVTQIYQAAAALNGGNPQPKASITVSPNSGSLTANQKLQFTATVSGLSNSQVSWSISPAGTGSISASGLYTAPSSVASQTTVNVTATSAADTTQTASATVTLNSSVSVSVNPNAGKLSPGQTLQFTASVSGATNQAVTWSVVPSGAGSISASGLYTAPGSVPTSETVTIRATSAADPAKSASASISLSPSACPAAGINAFTGCYYLDTTFGSTGGLGFSRVDPQINFNWGTSGPGGGVGPNNFSVKWQGTFTFNAASYTFSVATDDGSILYVDGQAVINEWGVHAAFTTTQTVNLTAGAHLIEVDYYQVGGLASASVGWTQNQVGITVSPLSGGSLNPGQTLQFAAAVTGTNNQAVTWSVSPSGAGAISATGLYTAPSTITAQQTVTITATSAADPTKSASGSVTLVPLRTAAACPAPVTNAFTGCYYLDTNFGANSGLAFSRTDSRIDFNWGTSGPGNGIGGYSYSVRWKGNFTFNAGVYTFSDATDDGSILYIDGQAVINEWGAHPAYTTTQSVSLSAGTHLIQLDYFQAGGDASANLSWSQTGGAAASTCPGPATNAFTGCYYGDQTFGSSSGLIFTRTDPQINFYWGTNGPGNGLGAYNFSVKWQGNFTFTAGAYNFSIATDDGSILYIDGQAVINEWGVHPAYTTTQQVNLTAGTHLVELDYYQAGGDATATVNWSPQ